MILAHSFPLVPALLPQKNQRLTQCEKRHYEPTQGKLEWSQAAFSAVCVTSGSVSISRMGSFLGTGLGTLIDARRSRSCK